MAALFASMSKAKTACGHALITGRCSIRDCGQPRKFWNARWLSRPKPSLSDLTEDRKPGRQCDCVASDPKAWRSEFVRRIQSRPCLASARSRRQSRVSVLSSKESRARPFARTTTATTSVRSPSPAPSILCGLNRSGLVLSAVNSYPSVDQRCAILTAASVASSPPNSFQPAVLTHAFGRIGPGRSRDRKTASGAQTRCH